jgi:NAD(P)-dependent dehydrogenase (short-subunit alcohol dehydrogenase family)
MATPTIPQYLGNSLGPGTSVAVVTGSAQGIGRAIALRLARDGFHVVVNDLPANSEMLEELKKEIESGNGSGKVECEIVCGDVSEEGDVKRMVETAVERFGGVDVVSPFLTLVPTT